MSVQDDGVSDSGKWASWDKSSRLAGVPVPTVEHAVRVGRISRRAAHGARPSLDRASVLEWVAWYREVTDGRAQRQAARERAKGSRGRRSVGRASVPSGMTGGWQLRGRSTSFLPAVRVSG